MKEEELGTVAYTCALSMQTEAEESAVEEDRPWVDFQVTKRLFKTKISSTPPPHTHTRKKGRREGRKNEKRHIIQDDIHN